MNRSKRTGFIWSGIMLLSFILWTILIQTVDVQPVGVKETSVGFSTVNLWFHRLTGVHMGLYTITDWLGLVPIAVCIGFGMLGLMQWIRRKSIAKVDRDILLLGGYYILVILGYLIFEMIPINYRPILIDGAMEASYPSSTTLLVLSVMPTLLFQVNRRAKSQTVRRITAAFVILFSAFMVIGRLAAGVHWLTDIVGSVLLSAGLYCLYRTAVAAIYILHPDSRKDGMKQEKSMAEQLIVCGKPYRILKLLGHGKGGYSYLAEDDGQQVVVKQIHHESCDYYAFGNKIEAEQRDYERLRAAGIRIPHMLAIDMDAERIVKEYIEGPTVFDLVRDGASAEPYLAQVQDMAAKAKAAGLNIDWFPTNFVVRDGLIWYVDYECNNYMDEWILENWGIRYWSRTPEFEAYLKEHMPEITIREERVTAEEYIDFLKRTDLGSQYPKERFEERIARLVNTVSISLTARNEQGLLVGVLFGLTDYAYWLYVTDLGVDRDYTRQGIGKRLMKTAHHLAGGEKDIAVYLIANENAVSFYEKCGMRKADDVMQYNHVEWTEFTVT